MLTVGLHVDDCVLYRLDQTLGKPGAWMVNGDNKEKQKMTVVARLSRIESQVSAAYRIIVSCKMQGRLQRRKWTQLASSLAQGGKNSTLKGEFPQIYGSY